VSQSWEPFGLTRRLGEEASKPAAKQAPARGSGPSRRALKREPAKRLVVITCMDARLDPLAMLGLAAGDANVIRNAGAVISDDVLRSLRAAHALLGARRAMVIGHTDCAGHESDAAAEASVRDGLRRIRGSAAVPADFRLEGMMYDVRTGTLTRLK
jgi:carbonic anhydrase